MHVYISGPMTGLPDSNREAFRQAAFHWRENTYDVCNPVDIYVPDGSSWETYLREDLKALLNCTAIAMLPGWEQSRGARVEHLIAVILDMPVFDAITMAALDVPPKLLDQPSVKVVTESLVDAAQRLVKTDRQRNYDHPLDNFTRIAQIWSVILKTGITPDQVALCMIGLKLARESYSHTEDNLVDTIGYTLCLDMLRTERERRALESHT